MKVMSTMSTAALFPVNSYSVSRVIQSGLM